MGNSNSSTKQLPCSSDSVSLNSFILLGFVGRGTFGKVRIVKHKQSGKLYALKYFSKEQIAKAGNAMNIVRERKILAQLRHPFICGLRYAFLSSDHLFLVVDLKTGGDLRFHLSRQTFTENAISFVIAELACAIEYIHERGVAHRDVKPENVLFDADGHVSLADFNVAIRVPSRKSDANSTSSSSSSSGSSSQSSSTSSPPLIGLSGTVAYLAPEVYEGSGYGTAIDWWALGVVLYECIYSTKPFPSKHREKLVEQIRSARPAYPETSPPVSVDALQTMKKLLTADPSARLGATGLATFFEEPFFGKYTREGLEKKIFKPVFVPSSDTLNYDKTYEVEELLLADDRGLQYENRSDKRSRLLFPSYVEKKDEEQYALIETHFLPFDYSAVTGSRRLEKTTPAHSRVVAYHAEKAHSARCSPSPPKSLTLDCRSLTPSDSADSVQIFPQSKTVPAILTPPVSPHPLVGNEDSNSSSEAPGQITVITTTVVTPECEKVAEPVPIRISDEQQRILRKKTARIPQHYVLKSSHFDPVSSSKASSDYNRQYSQNSQHSSQTFQKSNNATMPRSGIRQDAHKNVRKERARSSDSGRNRARNSNPRPSFAPGVLGKCGARIVLRN
ncbi:kinase-like domain-containing protein [Myxozyma melibiosi]|uniref:non-specific serine/threonine protein kinase n=1 Tax=Myxozyma melibiosi TaxID=54550 RepID=A0ABR1F476_9ASCO